MKQSLRHVPMGHPSATTTRMWWLLSQSYASCRTRTRVRCYGPVKEESHYFLEVVSVAHGIHNGVKHVGGGGDRPGRS